MVTRKDFILIKYVWIVSLLFLQVNSFVLQTKHDLSEGKGLHNFPVVKFGTTESSSKSVLQVSPQTSSSSPTVPSDNIGLATAESLENVHNTLLTRADGKEFLFKDLLVNEKDPKNGISIVVFLRHFG